MVRHDHHERGHAPPSTEGESGGVCGDAHICLGICDQCDTSDNSVQRCVSDRGPANQGDVHSPSKKTTGKPATKSNRAGRDLDRRDSANRKIIRSNTDMNVSIGAKKRAGKPTSKLNRAGGSLTGRDSSSCGRTTEPAPRKPRAGRAPSNKSNGKSKGKNNRKKKSSRLHKNFLQAYIGEVDPEKFAAGCHSTAEEFDKTQRRSARLAKRQQRTGRHRAACRQEEAKEMARKAMARTRSKLRANDKEVLEAMEDTPGKKRRSRKAANSHRKDNAKTAPIPAKLRKAAKVTVKKLTDD